MSKIYLIANPAAARGSAVRVIPQVEMCLAEAGLSYELVRTQYPGHAIELAHRAARSGIPLIVAAGGDGTVNEVVNGMMQASREGASLPTLGVLCTGRGNDFAGSMGIPEELALGCAALAAGKIRKIDIGRVSGGKYPEGRYFANCVGVGFDAIATIEVSKLPRLGGFLSFFIAVLKTIFLYNRAPLATIEYNGNSITQRSLMISVMNGRRLGDGFIMAPNSQPDDGLFDLCIAEQMSSLQVLRMIPYFLRGTQETQPTIKTGRGAHITVQALDGVLPGQSDGEIISIEGQRLEIELLPRHLEVIIGTG